MASVEQRAYGSANHLCAALSATSRELRISSLDQLALSKRSGVVEAPEQLRVSASTSRFIMGLGCATTLLLLVGLFVVAVLVANDLTTWHRWAGPLGIAFVARVVLLFVPFWAEQRTVNAIARKRLAPAGFEAPEPVGVEPAATYHRMKLMADDVGLMYHDRAHRRILIDGLRHRYLICADDVERLEIGNVKLGAGVRLDVRIGSCILSMVASARRDAKSSDRSGNPTLDRRVIFARHVADTLQRQVSERGA